VPSAQEILELELASSALVLLFRENRGKLVGVWVGFQIPMGFSTKRFDAHTCIRVFIYLLMTRTGKGAKQITFRHEKNTCAALK
jgi:hypothetical protein